MIEKDKLKELVRSYLPQAEDNIIDCICEDIMLDAEVAIFTMIRQAVANKRYICWKNSWLSR